MSRPLAAKSAGTCLKHVLNSRLRSLDFANGVESAMASTYLFEQLGAGARGLEHCPLAEDDPLPPEDRLGFRAGPNVDALYRAQRPGLLRFLRRRTEPAQAGDLVQQVFLRFCGLAPERQTAVESPVAYLWRSAANIAADHAKSDHRRAATHHVPIEDVELAGPDQVAALEARDMLQRLEEALQRLKPRTREIFLAHRIDGYSYIEIAEITGLSVKGVEK